MSIKLVPFVLVETIRQSRLGTFLPFHISAFSIFLIFRISYFFSFKTWTTWAIWPSSSDPSLPFYNSRSSLFFCFLYISKAVNHSATSFLFLGVNLVIFGYQNCEPSLIWWQCHGDDVKFDIFLVRDSCVLKQRLNVNFKINYIFFIPEKCFCCWILLNWFYCLLAVFFLSLSLEQPSCHSRDWCPPWVLKKKRWDPAANVA